MIDLPHFHSAGEEPHPNGITEASGDRYIDWLMAMRPEVKGRPNTDLSAYFFRRAADLLGSHGALGFVATNTIAQGDSRLMALKPLVDGGGRIYEAESSRRWSGDADVVVAVVHLAFGTVAQGIGSVFLDGERVPSIDSRLTSRVERPDPVALAANLGVSFMGPNLMGIGLVVTAEEFAQLVSQDARNAVILRPYLGGEDVNTSPECGHSRYLIDFGSRSLEEAERWPSLLRIVEEKVKPVRERDKRGTYKTYWWRPGESGGALVAALTGRRRCLVNCQVSKHLIFAWQPTDLVFAHTLYVYAFEDDARFAVMQSRVHETWARLLSSDFGSSSTSGPVLRYAASDCFHNFPFPSPEQMLRGEVLDSAGCHVNAFRAQYMVNHRVGLTITYNRLKDPLCAEPQVLELRKLNEEMDRRVLDAYGWSDIAVPAYCSAGDDEKAQRNKFDNEVIDRLFLLNAKRAGEETIKGLGAVDSKQKKRTAASAPRAPRKARGRDPAKEQLALAPSEPNVKS